MVKCLNCRILMKRKGNYYCALVDRYLNRKDVGAEENCKHYSRIYGMIDRVEDKGTFQVR